MKQKMFRFTNTHKHICFRENEWKIIKCNNEISTVCLQEFAKSIKNDGKIIPNSLKCSLYISLLLGLVLSECIIIWIQEVSKQQKNLYGLRTTGCNILMRLAGRIICMAKLQEYSSVPAIDKEIGIYEI